MIASVGVDPRVELMSVIFRLAGNPEYAECNLPRYESEVKGHFAGFGDHRAVRLAAELRERRYVRWAAPISLAVHIADAHSLTPMVPLDPPPPGLDRRWEPMETSDFLDAARDFAHRSGFGGFISAHQDLYLGAARQMEEALARWGHLDWFDAFYGGVTRDRFHVVVALLTGQNSYGASFQGPDAREIYAVQAVDGAGDEGLPVFDHDTVGCIVHELSHAYVTPMIHEHACEFEHAGEQIFPAGKTDIEGYGSWLEMTHETLVRACEMRYYITYLGDEATARKLAWNARAGFALVEPLFELLAGYESDRQRYPTLTAFIPEIVRLFEDKAKAS